MYIDREEGAWAFWMLKGDRACSVRPQVTPPFIYLGIFSSSEALFPPAARETQEYLKKVRVNREHRGRVVFLDRLISRLLPVCGQNTLCLHILFLHCFHRAFTRYFLSF